MYLGSFLNFLGLALVKSSPAGVLLALVVGLTYKAALLFETPFVKAVYEARRRKKTDALEEDDDDEEEGDASDEWEGNGRERLREKEE